jgi:hypothetical protein
MQAAEEAPSGEGRLPPESSLDTQDTGKFPFSHPRPSARLLPCLLMMPSYRGHAAAYMVRRVAQKSTLAFPALVSLTSPMSSPGAMDERSARNGEGAVAEKPWDWQQFNKVTFPLVMKTLLSMPPDGKQNPPLKTLQGLDTLGSTSMVTLRLTGGDTLLRGRHHRELCAGVGSAVHHGRGAGAGLGRTTRGPGAARGVRVAAWADGIPPQEPPRLHGVPLPPRDPLP